MIDFGVSAAAPIIRDTQTTPLHVFGLFCRSIPLAKSAHDNIGADAGIAGNIAVWKVDPDVGRIVASSNLTLLNSSFDELLELR